MFGSNRGAGLLVHRSFCPHRHIEHRVDSAITKPGSTKRTKACQPKGARAILRRASSSPSPSLVEANSRRASTETRDTQGFQNPLKSDCIDAGAAAKKAREAIEPRANQY